MLNKNEIADFLTVAKNCKYDLFFRNFSSICTFTMKDQLDSWSEINDEYTLQFNQCKDVKFTFEGIELFTRLNAGLISFKNSFGTKLNPNFGSSSIDCKLSSDEATLLLDYLIGNSIYGDSSFFVPQPPTQQPYLLGNLIGFKYNTALKNFDVEFQASIGNRSILLSLGGASMLIYLSYNQKGASYIFDSGIMYINPQGLWEPNKNIGTLPLTVLSALTRTVFSGPSLGNIPVGQITKTNQEEPSPTKKCTCGALKCNSNASEFDHSSWCDLVKKD